MTTLNDEQLAALNAKAERWTPQQILAFALSTWGGVDGKKLVIASSFSAEDVVVIDVAVRISRRFRVITLDTGRLHEETYALMSDVQQRYGSRVEVFFPKHDAVEQLVQLKGLHSFRNSVDDRKECCRIRKVEPLQRALTGVDAWATGLRQSQSVTRAALQPFERDVSSGQERIKVSPLWRFSDEDLWKYVKEHGVPVSPLHAQGYPSIGCAPCTRAIKPGEDVRAGRWWWESPEHKECGLHPSHPALQNAEKNGVAHAT